MSQSFSKLQKSMTEMKDRQIAELKLQNAELDRQLKLAKSQKQTEDP
jgi:hypothetical protein